MSDFFFFFSPVAVKPFSTFFLGKVFVFTGKGGEDGAECGTLGVGAGGLGSGHPPESRSAAGQGEVNAGGCTWGIKVL